MQRVENTLEVVVLGAGGSGKSALSNQFMYSHFMDEDTAGLQDCYASVSDGFIRRGEFFIIVCAVKCYDDPLTTRKEVGGWVQRVLRLKEVNHVPGFLVATKCDLPRHIKREDMIDDAIKYGFQGYYETSAKTAENVQELFHDVVRQMRINRASPEERAKLIKEMPKRSGLGNLLPWNWGKKAHAPAVTRLIASGMAISEEEIEEYRFPEPTVSRAPITFYNDLRQLIEDPEGLKLADVQLVSEEGGVPLPAHRILLNMRSEYLRSLTRHAKTCDIVTVCGLSAEVLQHVRDFIYTDRLPYGLSKELLRDLAQAGTMCNIPDLVQDAQMQGKLRAMADSAVVEKQMKPALAVGELSDVTFVVGAKKFELHRAIVWSRSAWFRALLSEKWGANSSHTIQVTSMSAEVFGIVVDYLYTSRSHISPEIAIDVLVAADLLNLARLVQMAELALQPVIEAGNAVPLYLAGEAHGAKQLMALAKYWMAMDIQEARKHEQWSEIPEVIQKEVAAEYARLEDTKSQKKAEREQRLKIPCLFTKEVPTYEEYKRRRP